MYSIFRATIVAFLGLALIPVISRAQSVSAEISESTVATASSLSGS